MTVVTVRVRAVSRVKSRVLSVPARLVWPGIRVVVGGTSTVSGSRRGIPNMSDHAPPPVQIGNGVTGGPGLDERPEELI